MKYHKIAFSLCGNRKIIAFVMKSLMTLILMMTQFSLCLEEGGPLRMENGIRGLWDVLKIYAVENMNCLKCCPLAVCRKAGAMELFKSDYFCIRM